MKTKPLTRLSVTLMLMGVTLAVVAIGWVAFGASMFSPGQLNARSKVGVRLNGVSSHAELSNHCAACHVAPWKSQTMGSRCQDCHSDIRSQIAGKEPLHGRLTSAQDCRKCHGEHKGALAELTSLANFNHTATAFKLTGRHQTVTCEQCHTNQTYQGTPQTCASCHADPPVHKGRFGLACADCHSTATWKGASFNHPQFPINHGGAQRKDMGCAICHHVPGDFKAYTCYGCHEHQPAKMAKEHKRIPIAKLEDCVSCHGGGRKKEGRQFRGGEKRDDD